VARQHTSDRVSVSGLNPNRGVDCVIGVLYVVLGAFIVERRFQYNQCTLYGTASLDPRGAESVTHIKKEIKIKQPRFQRASYMGRIG
jgi:hypothetical protein